MLDDRKSECEHGVPGEMEERLIKVEAVVEVAETVMLRLAERLVFIHLPIAVEVGPSFLIGQNLGETRGPSYYCYCNCSETMKVKQKQTE